MFGDRKIFQTIVSLGLENSVRIFLGAVASILVGRYLGPEAYGKFNYVISLVLIFSPIINFSMNDVVVQQIVNSSSTDSTIFKSGLILRIILGLFGVGFCLLYSYLNEGPGLLFNLVAFYALFFFLKSFDIVEYFFIAKEKVSELSKPRTFIFIFMNLVKIFFVYLQKDWRWFIYISSAEVLLIFFLYLVKSSRESWFSIFEEFDKNIFMNLLKKSSPFFLITLMTILFSRVDHLLIWEYLGNKNLGEYSVVVKWGELLNFIPLLLTSAFLPRIVEEAKNTEEPKSLKFFFRLNFVASIFITIFFLCFGPLFIRLLYGKAYLLAPSLIRIYSLQISLSFFYVALVRYLLVFERMKSAIFLYGFALVLNLLINLILIPRFELLGAVIASVLAYLFSLMILISFQKKVRAGAIFYCKSLF